MIGQGVLRESLLDPEVQNVLSIGRSLTGQRHPKLRELVHTDFLDSSALEPEMKGFDGCFFCLGVSSTGMSEERYQRVTHDITMAVARTLANLNPDMTFIYVSGMGTDSTERGRVMWAQDRECSDEITVQGTVHVPAGVHSTVARDSFEDQAVPGILHNKRTDLPLNQGALPPARDNDGGFRTRHDQDRQAGRPEISARKLGH